MITKGAAATINSEVSLLYEIATVVRVTRQSTTVKKCFGRSFLGIRDAIPKRMNKLHRNDPKTKAMAIKEGFFPYSTKSHKGIEKRSDIHRKLSATTKK